MLNERFDLRIRSADRVRGQWESCGDIVERHSGKALGRVYGRGSSSAAAEQELQLEAERWLLKYTASR